MGFDLNGLAPIGATEPRPKRPEPEVIGTEENKTWKYDKKELEEYHEKLEEWSNQEGTYFRNNVWWWRPLADYTLEYSKVLPINEKTLEGWHTNSGHKVKKEEAIQIGKQLNYLIKSGHTKKFEKKYMTESRKAQKYNETIREKMDKIGKLKRNKDLVPRDYNKEDKAQWDKLYSMQKRIADYPFSVENVKAFAKFCLASGGFEIC